MTRSMLALAASAALLLAASPGMAAAPQVGAPAPDFVGMTDEGKAVKLSDLKGKTVVLEWHNHDCPFVRKHYDTKNMQGLQKEATGKGVVWLTVVSSTKGEQGYVTPAESIKRRQMEGSAETAKLLDPDGKIGRAYDARVTPHMYVVAPDGKLAYMGGIDDKATTRRDDVKTAQNYVRPAVDAVLAGKPAQPAATRAYGCTVKYTN